MRIRTQAFHVPKRGNAEAEYEDAFFPESCVDREVSAFRCAVADGASESAFAGLWARLLVRGFGRRRLRLGRLRQMWHRATNSRPLPWYLETKILSGAHATFLGLSIREGKAPDPVAAAAEPEATAPEADAAAGDGEADASADGPAGAKEWLPKDAEAEEATDEPAAADEGLSGNGEAPPAAAAGSWRALAVGDSCLFHLRADELQLVGPVCASDQFGNTPYLLSSRARDTIRREAAHVSIQSGCWQPQDIFCLATDALAQWLLAEQEGGRPPWAMLRDLIAGDDPSAFARLVEDRRAEGALHNDDTTLLQVEVA
jgi:serine/threonine protein phosphatase PrpC